MKYRIIQNYHSETRKYSGYSEVQWLAEVHSCIWKTFAKYDGSFTHRRVYIYYEIQHKINIYLCSLPVLLVVSKASVGSLQASPFILHFIHLLFEGCVLLLDGQQLRLHHVELTQATVERVLHCRYCRVGEARWLGSCATARGRLGRWTRRTIRRPEGHRKETFGKQVENL